jgi:phosphatidylglycerol:prolipoprotein diacylglycerol transferase
VPASKLPGDVDHLALGLSIAAFAGARIGQFALYDPRSIIEAPIRILQIYQGGMSFHGGLASLLLFAAWYARRYRLQYRSILDRVALCAPLGIFLGRIGNFLNSELYGMPFSGPWAVVFARVDQEPRHPSQLYEAGTEGLLIMIVLWWLYACHRAIASPGLLAGVFLVLYAATRSACEIFRYPIDGVLSIGTCSITWGQAYSVPFALMGMVLLMQVHWRKAERR